VLVISSIHSAASRSMTCWCSRSRCRTNAREPVQYLLSTVRARLGVLTDTGLLDGAHRIESVRFATRWCSSATTIPYACERALSGGAEDAHRKRLGHLDNELRGRYSRRSIAAG